MLPRASDLIRPSPPAVGFASWRTCTNIARDCRQGYGFMELQQVIEEERNLGSRVMLGMRHSYRSTWAKCGDIVP